MAAPKLPTVNKDYDEAVAEVEGRPYTFRFGGETFTIDLNVDGGFMLDMLESARDQFAVVGFFRSLLGVEDWARLKATRQYWPKYEALFQDIMSEMAGPGNGSAPSAPS